MARSAQHEVHVELNPMDGFSYALYANNIRWRKSVTCAALILNVCNVQPKFKKSWVKTIVIENKNRIN